MRIRAIHPEKWPRVDLLHAWRSHTGISAPTLYAGVNDGTGAANNQPLGLLNTVGVNNIAFPAPGAGSAWLGLNDMRLACFDHDVSPDSYALISSPTNERALFLAEPAAATAPSVWHSIPDPKFFFRECSVDNRFFSGVFAYLAIGLFGGTATEPGLDLVVDAVTQPGRVIVTGAIYADVAVTWPEVFAFSEADPVVAAKEPAAEKKKAA
jgi:hypothetical protein